MRPDWTSTVVACLCELKRDGQSFGGAWKTALALHPPRGRDLGEARPTLFPRPGDTESVVEAFRRFCDDAWHGRRPALRHFSVEAMHDADWDTDDSAGRVVRKSRPPALAA